MDVFQAGLRRGWASLRNNVLSAYVEHADGRRIYLRIAVFIYEANAPFDKSRFLCVKAAHGDDRWEPIKGQVELRDGKMPLQESMQNAVVREVREEAKIKDINDITYTGRFVEGREKTYPKNHTFQYHIYTATVTRPEFERARQRLHWCRTHPSEFAQLHDCQQEKEDLNWYDATKPVFGRWSPGLIGLHLA